MCSNIRYDLYHINIYMVLQSSCVQDIKGWLIFFKVETIFVYISASSFKAPILSMGEGRKQLLKGPNTQTHNHEQAKDKEYRWVIMEGHDNDDDNINGRSSASNSIEDSTATLGSTSSSDMVDDASSTSISCSSSSHSSVSGPLYELSELMAQLPIKRGLSKYFEGKSQSFTSLSSVMRIEDLAKKETPYRRKIKACKSYGGGLDSHKQYTMPKAAISKKASRGSLSSSSFPSRRGSFLGISRPPPIPAQKNF